MEFFRKIADFFQNVAKLLSVFPSWVSGPLLFIEIAILIMLLFWLHFTRSVGTLEVPDLQGQHLDVAREYMAEIGLNHRISWESSLHTPEKIIMSQVPRAGAEIKETRAVTLFVSEGPDYVTVPDLKGLALVEARSRLERETRRSDAGLGRSLDIGNIARVYSDEKQQNHIIVQQPAAGRRVLSGSRVDVLISRGPWPQRTVMPRLIGRTLPEARREIENASLEVGSVRYVSREDIEPEVVITQSPAPSIFVRESQPVIVTVNLAEDERPRDLRRYTSISVSPPLDVKPGRMRVDLIDRDGHRTVYEKQVAPGRKVEFVTSVQGSGRLIIYWNDEIYRFRQLNG